MKILVTAAGPKPARDKAGYVMDFARGLGAEVIALHITQTEDQALGEETLNIFAEAGQRVNVKVAKIFKKGDVIHSIIESAEEESVDFIIMGTNPGQPAADWVSTQVMEKTKIPVIVIPYEYKKNI